VSAVASLNRKPPSEGVGSLGMPLRSSEEEYVLDWRISQKCTHEANIFLTLL